MPAAKSAAHQVVKTPGDWSGAWQDKGASRLQHSGLTDSLAL